MAQGTYTTLTLSKGTYIDISIPSNTDSGYGEFQRSADAKVTAGGTKGRDHVYGFVSEFENVGTIEAVTSDVDIKVRYTHKENKPNRIFFFTVDDDQHTISIISMPIHDHSSIFQGGPAYGTYSYDKPEEG
jgi:hypothetical protein